MEKPINRRLFFVLLGGSIFGVIAVMPYVLTLQAGLLEELPIPLHVLLPIQILSNAAVFAVLIYVGLRLSKRVGLGVPILESWLKGREVKAHLKSILGISIALGVSVGFLITGIDLLFHALAGPIAITGVIPPIWQRFLAVFYGAINEEVIMRLFFMSLLVWVFHYRRAGFKRTKKFFLSPNFKAQKKGKPTSLSIWIAIITAALLFGIGHLPLAATLTQVTLLVATRVIVLNGIAGIVFGLLYWKKGLEGAMISHFSAGMVLQAVM